MSSAPRRLDSFDAPFESLEPEEQFEYIHSFFVWECRGRHGVKQLFQLIETAKPNQRILDEILLLRIIDRERFAVNTREKNFEIDPSMINRHRPSTEWVIKNFHRFNNDVLAREVFVSSFRRKDKSKDEEQQKRALLFAGINFWWMDFWDEDAFKETFKDEISKEESNLLDQNSIHKIIEDFGIHIDDCSTEQWLNFFMRNGIAIPDLLDISPTTWNVSHFDDESVSAHLYISSKGVTYTSEVIENCKLTPNIITKILLTLLDESTISSSCQEFLCNFLDQSDLETLRCSGKIML